MLKKIRTSIILNKISDHEQRSTIRPSSIDFHNIQVESVFKKCKNSRPHEKFEKIIGNYNEQLHRCLRSVSRTN
uniref:Uncharacterized protein n=1 Tax=Romanomermis culicivorax TaxID=13658 RepID=A0A915JJ98_ROMCU